MRKRQRIKADKEFQRVFDRGRSVANRQFVVYTYSNPQLKEFRIGLSVGKRVGNAVTRNRVKRYIRQAMQSFDGELKVMDYVIIARPPTAQLTYDETRSSLQHVLRIARSLPKAPSNQKKTS